ncbi:arginine deiminase [Anaeramoeba ignava]|uniref:Arginine deiminase n=1 Tax=Anaeramoeba ignava TaxID=1746090 RepID=A0A9Q0REP8_ANAIG|nr:arginine deiminase [Anaeramoeba ignava]
MEPKKSYIQIAELDQAHTIIMHAPLKDPNFGSLHPKAFLYEKQVSFEKAKKSHNEFVEKLKKYGVEVIKIEDVYANLKREELEEIAVNYLKYQFEGDVSDLTEENKFYISNEYKRIALSTLSVEQLLDIILYQPTVLLQQKNRDLSSCEIVHHPNTNLTFTRDQQIVTVHGLVMGSFANHQRKREVQIMRKAFEIMNIEIKGNVESPGFVEGGDFFPVSKDLSLIGVGCRTNHLGAKYILDNNLFGTRRVGFVVDEMDKNIQRMHLDTIFNIVDEKRVVLLDSIMGDSKIRRVVWEYVLIDNCYQLNRKVEFSEFLKQEGYQIIPISDQQQREYMLNFLNLGIGSDGKAIIISVHPDLEKVLREAGFEGIVDYVDYSGITAMYGAAHCSTQVFRTPKKN